MIALGNELDVSTDPNIREGDLLIGGVKFYGTDLTMTSYIEGLPTNKGSRLFLQSYVSAPPPKSLVPIRISEIIGRAETYFAEFWEDDPGSGKHPFVDALRNPQNATIQPILKSEMIS